MSETPTRLSLEVRSAESVGRGHAWIIFDHSAVPGRVVRLSIRRAGGGAVHLGPAGWQAPEALLEPEAVGPDAVTIGPAVVRHMEDGNYRVGLHDAQGALLGEGTVRWHGIAPPLDIGPGRGALGGERQEAPREPIARATTAAAPPPSPPRPPTPPARSAVEPSPAAPPLRAERDMRKRDAPHAGFPYALVGALLLVLAAVAGWFAYDQLFDDDAPPPIAASDQTRPTRAELKAYLDEGPEPEAVYERAQTYLRQGWAGESFLLLREAAHGRHGPSARAIARMYDPTSPADAPTPFSKPNAAEALEWYDRAAAAGVDVSRERADLRDWAEREAAAGDVAAARLLEGWTE